MKSRFLVSVAIASINIGMIGSTTHADEDMREVNITGYCLDGTMKNGEHTRQGVCAYRPQDIGKTAIIYNKDMELIGVYEIADTGKDKVRKGETVDIWFETKAECYEITQRGFIQIVDADG